MPKDTHWCGRSHRLTFRQLRLMDWMHDPQHPSLPQGEAIEYSHAMWSAAKLVELTGLYDDLAWRARAACLRDLHALVHFGEVAKVDDSRACWSTGPGFRA